METIIIGKIVGSVGLKGEVKVYNYSDKNRFDSLKTIIIDGRKVSIENARYMRNMVILKLKGIDTRNESESLKNREISIDDKEMKVLEEGEFFIKDLIGLRVQNIENGEIIGVLKEVIQNGPQDIYSIALERGGIALIPAVKEFIKSMSLEDGIKVKLIPGLIDEEV